MARRVSILLFTLLLAAGCSGTPEPQATARVCGSATAQQDDLASAEAAAARIRSLDKDELRRLAEANAESEDGEDAEALATFQNWLADVDDAEIERLKVDAMFLHRLAEMFLKEQDGGSPPGRDATGCRDPSSPGGELSGERVGPEQLASLEGQGLRLERERECAQLYMLVAASGDHKTMHFYCYREPDFEPLSVFRADGDGWRRER